MRGASLADPQLLRLNYGIFALHAVLMALFIAVPFALRDSGARRRRATGSSTCRCSRRRSSLMLPLLRRRDRPGRGKAVLDRRGRGAARGHARVLAARAARRSRSIVAALRRLLRRVQPARSDAAVARLQVRAARSARRGDRRLFAACSSSARSPARPPAAGSRNGTARPAAVFGFGLVLTRAVARGQRDDGGAAARYDQRNYSMGET